MYNRRQQHKPQRVHIITMGCAKNIVDSERLMAQLRMSNVELVPTLAEADVAVINTCGFIEAAKQESVDMIIENVRLKAGGKLKKVYAMGCLTERYMADLQKEIPEVDRFFGSRQLPEVLEELGADFKNELLGERMLTTPNHFAYLKISEGCDNPCSFCAIPVMRGKHVSRPIESVLNEARRLVDQGVKELVVIGQDTTYFGMDLYGERRLGSLLQSLADLPGVEWVRLMYAYPAKFPKDVLDVIAGHPKICNYIDMPVQHVADPVLKSMRRGISQRALRELVEEIRTRVPDIALRTTLIVGYPNETEREFEELLKFVNDIQFDRLGVFTYSQEEGTHAYGMGDPVSPREKERRRDAIMEAQQAISTTKNQHLINTTQRVVLDRMEGNVYVGRTERDAPEIDNEVFVNSTRKLAVGEFIEVDIDDATEYDLFGSVHEKPGSEISA